MPNLGDSPITFAKSFNLRRKIDLAPLALVLIVGAAQFGAYAMCGRPSAAALIAAVLFLPQFMVSMVVHNHGHAPMFRGRIANGIIDLLLYLETGMLVATFHLQHNLGHHRFYTDPARDPSTCVKRDGSTMGRLEYAARCLVRNRFDTIRIGKEYPVLLRRYYRAQTIGLLAIAALLTLKPINALILFVAPMVVVWFSFLAATRDDDIGLHSTNPFEASNSKTNRFLNRVIFNNGFHAAHHVSPGTHWSELPAVHEAIRKCILAPREPTFLNRIKRAAKLRQRIVYGDLTADQAAHAKVALKKLNAEIGLRSGAIRTNGIQG